MTRSDIEDPEPPLKGSRSRSPSFNSADESRVYGSRSHRYGDVEGNERRESDHYPLSREGRRSSSSLVGKSFGSKRSPSHSESEQPNHKRYKHSGHTRSRSPSSSSRVCSGEDARYNKNVESASVNHDHHRPGDPSDHAYEVVNHRDESSRSGRTPSRRNEHEYERDRSLTPRDSAHRRNRRDASRSRSPTPPRRRHDDYRGGRSRYGSPGRRRDYYHSRPWHGHGYYGRSGGSRHGRDWSDRRDDRRDWYRDRKDEKDEEPPMTEEERKKKELDDARRDDLTVLVVNLSLKAQEKDIWQFFTKHAGKVRTIKLIKDSRSGKSKGIGYVEFQDAESVLKSLNLTGQCILNQPIRVQASQAEKNRAAKAAKQQQEQLAAQGPTKIYIGGLVDELSGMTQDELCQLFSPFGPILQIDVPKDPYTHRNRGYAFVQYLEASHARDAMMAMHGFDIGGKQIRVGFAGQDQAKVASSATLDGTGGVDLDRIADDHDDRILHGGSAMRIALSQKLAQKVNDQSFNGLMSGNSLSTSSSGQVQSPPPTEVVTLEGMFTKQEVETDGLDILDEVCEDVKKECLKFGVVIDLFIDHENIDGKVHVRFADSSQAASAVKNLNGRYFGGTAIKASYTDPVEYATMRQQAL